MTNDELKAAQLLTTKFRNFIKNIKADNIMIEIHENKLIIGNKKTIDTETALEIVAFLNNISQSF